MVVYCVYSQEEIFVALSVLLSKLSLSLTSRLYRSLFVFFADAEVAADSERLWFLLDFGFEFDLVFLFDIR